MSRRLGDMEYETPLGARDVFAEFEKRGYSVTSAYTVAKAATKTPTFSADR